MWTMSDSDDHSSSNFKQIILTRTLHSGGPEIGKFLAPNMENYLDFTHLAKSSTGCKYYCMCSILKYFLAPKLPQLLIARP